MWTGHKPCGGPREHFHDFSLRCLDLSELLLLKREPRACPKLGSFCLSRNTWHCIRRVYVEPVATLSPTNDVMNRFVNFTIPTSSVAQAFTPYDIGAGLNDCFRTAVFYTPFRLIEIQLLEDLAYCSNIYVARFYFSGRLLFEARLETWPEPYSIPPCILIS